MRIGIFTDDYLPRRSGVVTSVCNLVKGLRELGHEVYIVAPRYPGYKDEDSYIIRVPSFKPYLIRDVRAAFPRSRTVKQIIKLELDIVHSATQFNIGVIADYVASKSQIPHVTTAHTILPELAEYYPLQSFAGYALTTQFYQLYFNQPIKYSLPSLIDFRNSNKRTRTLFKRQLWNMQNMFFNNVTHVFAPSNNILSLLRQHGMEVTASVVMNGIDTTFYNKTRTRQFLEGDKIQIVSVGRLSAEKRHDISIKAISLTDNTVLHIVGDGPDKYELKRLAHRLKISDRVIFHGSKDQAGVRDLLLDSDVLLLSSYRFDNQPMVLLEAAAAGTPVIYCDKHLEESVSPNSAVLSGHRYTDIKEAILSINDVKTLESMSSAGYKLAERFTYQRFASTTADIYNKQTGIKHKKML